MHPGLKSWRALLVYAINLFSIPLLLRTLFSPWERDGKIGPRYGLLEKVVFAIMSRIIGFCARIIFIFLGLIVVFLTVLSFPVFFFLPIKLDVEHLSRLGVFGANLSYGQTFNLNRHSRDMMSPFSLEIYGKDKALRMIERGLSKDTNHNVLIVGDTGVGKTTLLSYLGRVARSGLSFPGIRNHRIVELSTENISLEDFSKVLKESSEAGNIILVIENIHNYTGLFNLLEPYLNSKELGIMVTTDFGNYDRVLKQYPEFVSKFEKVDLLATGEEETIAVLKNVARITKTRINDDALYEIVRLADRFITNLAEPLRSISVLEELRALGRKITVDDVRQVVSDRTNMPIGSIGKDESRVLLDLENTMRESIVGQIEAVREVSQALRRLRTGVADPSKPAGSFLFLGPTGVGKTYTAKVLAEAYFGRKNAMIRFDMSEFSLPQSVSLFSDRLGAVIEEAPLSLVFLDELEKSNRLIHNLLLQVLDEGTLTRENGRVVSFKDAMIITTSNAGSRDLIENINISKNQFIDNLIKQDIFTPEFLNRFSGIVLFKPLNETEVRNITRLLLKEFADRLMQDKNIKLVITDALVEKVASAGFDPDFGARPIKRAIEEIVENEVANKILAGQTSGEIKII